MSKGLKRIKQIQKVIEKLMSCTKDLHEIAKEEPNEKIRKMLLDFSLTYGMVNIQFIKYVMLITSQVANTDKINESFNKLMKPLEEQIKKEKEENGK